MKKTIIFDQDGTLVDIEPLFIRILNALAPEFGFAPLREEELPELKKFHLKSLIWKRLGFRLFLFPLILKRGREEYHKLVSEVQLFSGIQELVNALRAKGYSVGIVSSSRQDTITALMKRFGIHMDFIYQCDLFSKAKTLKQVIKDRGLLLKETIYIGDEVRDLESCRKIGLDIISVTWGLNSKEALKQAGGDTVDTREELLARFTEV